MSFDERTDRQKKVDQGLLNSGVPLDDLAYHRPADWEYGSLLGGGENNSPDNNNLDADLPVGIKPGPRPGGWPARARVEVERK